MTYFTQTPQGAPWCSYCGSLVHYPSAPKPWPWRLNSKEDLLAYLDGLESEVLEWMLTFYVASDLRLIAVEPPVRGGTNWVRVDFAKLIGRAAHFDAGGFILVHNHPGGTPRPSRADLDFTQKLRRISAELNVPMLDHFILAERELIRVGDWI